MADLTETAVSLIGGALAGGVVSYGLQWQKSRDENTNNAQAAQRSYEYDARKQLYAELQPLIFQLVEACDSADRRLGNMARASREGHLAPDHTNWLNQSDQYYRLSTAYRFILPVVLFKLCQRRLTLVDLGVDQGIRRQYGLARLIYQTWNDGFDLAEAEPKLDYLTEPWSNDPAIHTFQHLVIGELDLVAEAMTTSGPDGKARPVDYGEFVALVNDPRPEKGPRLKIVLDLFADFRPDRRPVLWRLLMCQYLLWHAFVAGVGGTAVDLAIPDKAEKRLSWRTDEELEATPDDIRTTLEIALRRVQREHDRTAAYLR
jgi:hypothetical protein